MKLLMYSGGQTSRNKTLHATLADLVGAQKRKSFTYLPFCHENSELYFDRAVKRYRRFGFSHFKCLSVDRPFSASEAAQALESDVVYLAGGNTFYFLKHLKESGLLTKLRRYVKQGGVLAGLSAGGLIMTPHIALAGYPKFDADENEVGLTDLKSLNLVPFEFYPHFYNREPLIQALLKYSRQSLQPIFACKDGSGLMIKGEQLTVIGQAVVFYQNTKLVLNDFSMQSKTSL